MFEENIVRAGPTGYFLPKIEIKECNVLINGQNFFDQPVKNDIKTCGNNRKIATHQGDDCRTSSINCNLIKMHLSKQQPLYNDPKAIQQINFMGNLELAELAPIFVILKEVNKTILVIIK